jgi:trans-aconitate 2-methyltransferase
LRHGELTRSLHERTVASTTLGLDSSRAMLERSASHAGEGLTFELGDIAEWAPSEPFDLVFSNVKASTSTAQVSCPELCRHR